MCQRLTFFLAVRLGRPQYVDLNFWPSCVVVFTVNTAYCRMREFNSGKGWGGLLNDWHCEGCYGDTCTPYTTLDLVCRTCIFQAALVLEG